MFLYRHLHLVHNDYVSLKTLQRKKHTKVIGKKNYTSLTAKKKFAQETTMCV